MPAGFCPIGGLVVEQVAGGRYYADSADSHAEPHERFFVPARRLPAWTTDVPLDCGWETRGTVRNYGRSQVFIQSALVGQGSIFGLFPPKRDDVNFPCALATGERLDFVHSGEKPMGLDLHQPVVFQLETGDGTRFTLDIGGRGALGFGLTDDSLAPAFHGGTQRPQCPWRGP